MIQKSHILHGFCHVKIALYSLSWSGSSSSSWSSNPKRTKHVSLCDKILAYLRLYQYQTQETKTSFDLLVSALVLVRLSVTTILKAVCCNSQKMPKQKKGWRPLHQSSSVLPPHTSPYKPSIHQTKTTHFSKTIPTKLNQLPQFPDQLSILYFGVSPLNWSEKKCQEMPPFTPLNPHLGPNFLTQITRISQNRCRGMLVSKPHAGTSHCVLPLQQKA